MARRSLLLVVLLAVGVAAVLVGTAIQHERTYQRLLAQGAEALHRRDAGSAVEALSGAIALKPDSMVAHLRRGEAYLLRGASDARLAHRDFREAARLDPAAVRPLERLGDVQTTLGQYGHAADEYRKGLALDEGSPRVAYKLALATYQAGEVEEALTLTDRVLELESRWAEAHYLHGLCLVDRGEAARAAEAFRRALALDGRLHGARAQLAATARQRGRLQDELAELDRLARPTARPEVSVALGEALLRLGRVDEAVRRLDEAQTRFPDHAGLMATLGRAWLARAEASGDPLARTQASRWLQQAEAQERRAEAPTSETLAALGRARLLDGDPGAAVQLLQQAAALLPVSPSTLEDLARAAEQLDEWSLARAALERADALDFIAEPDRRAARTARLGDLSHRADDHASAAHWFDQASQLHPDDPSLVVRLIESHWAAGHRDEAARTLSAALAKWPEEGALRRLGTRFSSEK